MCNKCLGPATNSVGKDYAAKSLVWALELGCMICILA